ncbi:LamG-like jellyroll fold domain-containing protein [Mangrovimonas sp. YM274]|uniref:LamG-like jellyroll fold domain-containing protein n=1 Tax=Mangrovimonas sp. YM274 TaxID=3070660 RepID=UPI0027DD6CF4|nr:LamG-like jellyroll fold domain-containing protein [Mangrovimonas sp. YM274]WMI70228.1 LamG-like jellyroll fold domain-containing protein [Mangrovimonas sp. YM274]
MIKKIHKKWLLSAGFAATMLTVNAQTALNFDGYGDYIITDLYGPQGNSARTVEAWVDHSGSGQDIIVEWGGGDVTPEGGPRFTFKFQDRKLQIETGGGATNRLTGTTYNPLGWHHVAVTYDPSLESNQYKLYLDGEIEAQGNFTGTGTNTSNVAPIQIGARAGNPENTGYNGTIDDVRIWNVARTQGDIQENMNSELCEYPEELIAYYKLNEGVPGADNSAVTTVINEVSPSDVNELHNFGMNVAWTSNFVEGYVTNDIDITITQGETSFTANQADASYQWVDIDNGHAPIEGATGQTFSPSEEGNYAVEITVGGCVEMSVTVYYENDSLGIDDEVFAQGLQLYPNPTSGDLNVSLNGVYQTVEAQLVSITGKVVGQYQFSNTNGFSLGLNNVNSGVYFLNLKAGQLEAVTLKVVKM